MRETMRKAKRARQIVLRMLSREVADCVSSATRGMDVSVRPITRKGWKFKTVPYSAVQI